MFNKMRLGQYLFWILPKSRSLTGLLLICLPLTSLLLTSPALAQVPKLVRYQGQVVDSQGVPLEGPYTLHFRLYDAETAGNMVWDETQTGIPITKGQFSILLGQVASLATVDWDQPRWLSVQVNGDPELAPRQQITSVPLAIRAETAEVVKTSGITDDTNQLVPSGAIILWTSANCPAGYSRVAAFDGAMLKAGTASSGPTAAGLAELPTHTHGAGSYAGPEHVHNIWTDVNTNQPLQSNGIVGNYTYNATWKTVLIQPAGGGLVTGASASTGSGTVVTVVLCQKQ